MLLNQVLVGTVGRVERTPTTPRPGDPSPGFMAEAGRCWRIVLGGEPKSGVLRAGTVIGVGAAPRARRFRALG